jgi:hypothetical protein
MNNIESPAVTVFGFLVAVTAVVGTQVLGWEWGAGQLLPTLIGVTVASIALLLVLRRNPGNDIGPLSDFRR